MSGASSICIHKNTSNLTNSLTYTKSGALDFKQLN